MKPLSAKDLRKAYLATFGSEHGKAVLEDMRGIAGMSRQSYVPGDAMETVYRDGRKALIYMIEHHLNGEQEPERREQAEEPTDE